MSIDEYLQIERERGNILTGGGYVKSVSFPLNRISKFWFAQTAVGARAYII